MANDDEGSGFNDHQQTLLYSLIVMMSVIAMCVDLFIITTYLRFKALRKRSYELVFLLSACSFCSNVGYMMSPNPRSNTALCTVQGNFFCIVLTHQHHFYMAIVVCLAIGLWMNFFDLMMIGYTTVIAHALCKHSEPLVSLYLVPRIPSLISSIWTIEIGSN